jgi:NTE family protein
MDANLLDIWRNFMYGLVLEGGGGRGSYEIGACKALYENGIEFSCIAGTSVGALNGAILVQNDIEKAYNIWYNLSPSKVMNLTSEEAEELSKNNNKLDHFSNRIRRIKKIILEKGLDISPLINTVSNVIDEDRIRRSKIDFGIVTVDLTGRKALEIYKEDIPKGKLIDYLIASASLPGFKRHVIDGRIFLDGGFYNALPINLVKDKGCNNIIVIRTFAPGMKRRVDTRGLNLIHIAPSESLGSMLDFTCERARRNLWLGYYDAIQALKKL